MRSLSSVRIGAFHLKLLMSSSLFRPSVTSGNRDHRGGLCATDSNTLVAKDVFVPAHRVLSMTKDPKCRASRSRKRGYASCRKFPGI